MMDSSQGGGMTGTKKQLRFKLTKSDIFVELSIKTRRIFT